MTRLRRWLKRMLITIVVVGVLLAATWVFRWTILGGVIRRSVADAAADHGLEVEVAGFSGSLLGDVEVRDIRVTPTVMPHLIREASVTRARVRFSIRDLLAGDDRWLQEIEISGVRAVVDARGRFPDSGPTDDGTESQGTGGGGTAIVPRTVTVSDADLTLLAGPSRLEIQGGSVDVREVADRNWQGVAKAEVIRSILEDESEVFTAPRAEVEYVDDGLTVVTGGTREVLRADLSGIDDGFAEADVDLPLFGGGITGHVRTEVETDTVTATLDLTAVRAEPLLRFLPDLPVGLQQVSGRLDATLSSASTPDLDGVSGTFDFVFTEPRVDRWGAERVELNGMLADRVLTFEGRTTGPGTGVSGTLWLEETPRFEASVLVEEFDLKILDLDIADRDVRGVATGRASVVGTAEAPLFLADLAIVTPGYGEWSADRVEVDGRGGADGFDIERFVITRNGDRVTTKGRVSFGENVTFSAEGTVDVKSADVIVELCGVPYPDQLDASVTAAFSAAPDPEGRSRVTLNDLVVTSPMIVVTGSGLVTTLPPLNREFDENQISIVGDLAVQKVDAERIARRFGDRSFGAATGAGRVTSRGTIGDMDVTAVITSENAVLSLPDREGVPLEELTVIARHSGDRLVLEQLIAVAGDWGLTAHGALTWNPYFDPASEIGEAAVEGGLILVDVPLSLAGSIPGIAEAEGTVDTSLTFGGTVFEPIARGTIGLDAPRIVPADDAIPPVTDVDLSLTLSGAGLDGVRAELLPSTARILNAPVDLESGGATITFDPFRISAPSLEAKVRDLNACRLAECVGAEEVREGLLEADLVVTDGPEVDLMIRGGRIRIDALERIQPDQADGHLALRVHWGKNGLQVKDGALNLGDRALTINAEIPISPTLDPPGILRRDDAPLRVVATGEDLDLAQLSHTLPRLRIGGRADIRAELDGTLESPQGRAEVSVRGGFSRYPGVPSFDDVNGTLTLKRDGTVEVVKLTTLLGRGRLEVDPGGWLRLRRDGRSVTLGETSLRIHGANALLLRTRTMLVRAAPDLTLTGGGALPRLLGGDLVLSSVRYTERFELISRRPSLAPLPLTDDPFLSALNLDVRIHAPRESIRVRNNLLDAEFGGEIRLLGTVALPRPEGRIISDRGSVRLPTVTMKLVRGVAEFQRERPLQPRLDALLAANINRITVNVAAEGPLDRLEITTRSIPAMPEEDVITLLATGQVPEDVEQGTAATMAATLLYRQIVSEMDSSDPDDEVSTLEDLASRVEEISVDTTSLLGGGAPTWRALLRLDGEWLYLRGDQTDSFNYGLDLLFRLTFR